MQAPFLDYLGDNKSNNETINQSWQSGFLRPYFVFNTSPYDLLKSRGFDIIKDDKIRIEIQTYYDKSLPNLIDEISRNYELMGDFRNKYVSNLHKDPNGPLFIPSNVDAMRQDEIMNGLSMVLFWNLREKEQFSKLKELAEKLHADIDEYLKTQ